MSRSTTISNAQKRFVDYASLNSAKAAIKKGGQELLSSFQDTVSLSRGGTAASTPAKTAAKSNVQNSPNSLPSVRPALRGKPFKPFTPQAAPSQSSISSSTQSDELQISEPSPGPTENKTPQPNPLLQYNEDSNTTPEDSLSPSPSVNANTTDAPPVKPTAEFSFTIVNRTIIVSPSTGAFQGNQESKEDKQSENDSKTNFTFNVGSPQIGTFQGNQESKEDKQSENDSKTNAIFNPPKQATAPASSYTHKVIKTSASRASQINALKLKEREKEMQEKLKEREKERENLEQMEQNFRESFGKQNSKFNQLEREAHRSWVSEHNLDRRPNVETLNLPSAKSPSKIATKMQAVKMYAKSSWLSQFHNS